MKDEAFESLRPGLVICAALALMFPITGPAAVCASTIPPLELDSKRRVAQFALAMPAGSFDAALGQCFSVGLSASLSVPHFLPLLAVRATYRLAGDEATGWAVGLTTSAGTTFRLHYLDAAMEAQWTSSRGLYALQPALTVAWWWLDRRLVARAMIGPVLVFDPGSTWMQGWLVPNAELAYRLTEESEATLGGNALFGVRWFLH